MTNSKKRLFTVLAVAIVLCVSIIVLTACNTDSVVQFMVQDDNGEWQVLSSQTVGKKDTVSAPTAPVKDFYEFVDWYTDENFTTPFSSGTVAGNVNIYAKYNPIEVSVHINNDAAVTKNLADVANLKYNPGKELNFDGWYKDANCTVKWDGKEVVQNLYGRAVALITIKNGYEYMYSVDVVPGSVFADPAEQTVVVDGVEKTLEEKILLPYMSKYDIDYVDDNGVAIDFTKKIEKNTNITVLWNTKALGDCLKPLPESTEGHYYIEPSYRGFVEDVQKSPVLSFRNKVTRENKESVDGSEVITTETLVVDSISFYTDNAITDNIKKIIVGEGIQVVQNVNGGAASSVEEIVLPSTLKILDNSFNNMPKLKGVILPEGLEVLIGSFALDTYKDTAVDHSLGMINPNFEIVVPNSVKNIAMMPTNLKFSKTEETAKVGEFFKGKDGKIYLNHKDGKVLVADPEAVTGIYNTGRVVLPKAGTIVVPNGVVGIQVGTYASYYDYLILPASFKFVNYNANVSDYAAIYDLYNTEYTRGGNVLFDQNQFDQYFSDLTPSMGNDSNIDIKGLSITDTLGGKKGNGFHCGAGIVVMSTTKDARPTGIDLGFVKGGYYMNALPFADEYVSYADDKNTVYVVSVIYNNGSPSEIITKVDGMTKIDLAAIKESLSANNPAYSNMINNLKSFELYSNGVKVEENAEVTSDMYLTAVMVENNKLVINSTFRLSLNDDYQLPVNPSDATQDCAGFLGNSGKISANVYSVTGLTLDKIYQALSEAGANASSGLLPGEDVNQIIENVRWSYDNAQSVKIMMNDKEITEAELSNIDLSESDASISIVIEFAPYATLA